MKLCESCRYRNNTEYEKPCIIYRDDCEYYEKERGDMNEVGVEIVKTEESEESGMKYLNINVSDDEVERNPDIVRLCADAGILEYVKPKTGHWIADEVQLPDRVVLNYHCSVCGRKLVGYSTETLKDAPYCHCGARMESEDKE